LENQSERVAAREPTVGEVSLTTEVTMTKRMTPRERRRAARKAGQLKIKRLLDNAADRACKWVKRVAAKQEEERQQFSFWLLSAPLSGSATD
jgi:hypothetical protein